MDKKILHRVFEHIAARFPDRVALEEESRSISYRDLNRGANQIAYALKEMGVKSEVVVGLSLPAGIDYIMSVIAVQKAGGVFMPLDADAPPKRLEFMLNKTEPQIILTKDKLAEINSEKNRFSDANLDETPDPQAPNYIIFTSGSTGEPKAILGKLVSLSHFINWEISTFGFDENVKVSLFAPTTFDVSFRDIFVPLLAGGTLCIPNLETMRNIPQLVDWMTRSGLSLVHCVPTMFRLIRKELKARKSVNANYEPLPQLKNILLAGEALYGADVIEWIELVEDRIALTNLYGPSETTLAKIHYRIKERPTEPNRIIPLGEPISNTAILILKDNRLCKVGEIGEIHIKTPFMSHGYYKDNELTAKCFIQNPLTTEHDIIYKTGDLGRYQQDRQVEFIGRLDSQVKINGIRIELAEIESNLFAHEAIERPVVVAHATSNSENRLVCYYTLKEGISSEDSRVSSSGLRQFLSQFLPSYMIPSFFVQLNSFPLNINGKIDRRRLPKPEDLIYDRIPYAAPENEAEKRLASIYGEVLGIERVGVNTPFFELGGNSLNAIRIISRIFAEFRIEVAIRDFFDNPSIRQLAKILERIIPTSSDTDKDHIEPIAQADNYLVSHAQRRLWIFEQLDPNFIAYNIPGAYLIKGDLNINSITEAFRAVIRRHESLRTTFKIIDGEPRQVIHKEVEFNLPINDLTKKFDKAASIEQVKAELAKDAAKAFNLEKGPLMRVRLFKVADKEHVIGVNVHHIVTDALSQDIFMSELLTYYSAIEEARKDGSNKGYIDPFVPLTIHYKDYVAWHNIQEQGAKMQAARSYWQNKLSGELPILNLPTDYPRPMMQTANGDRLTFEFDPDIYQRLIEFGKERQSTIFMLLTALIKTLIYRYTGQEDIIIGTPIASRTHTDLENQIGLYINMLALRDNVSAKDDFDSFLSRVRKTSTEAFEYQIYPFDRLVGDLAIERDLSRNVGFDVMLVFHNKDREMPSVEGLTAEVLDFLNPTAKYDLTFTFGAGTDSLFMEIEYNTDLFLKERIVRLASHISVLTKSVLSTPKEPIYSLEIMTPEEKELVLFGFNRTEIPYPKDKTVTELVEENAARYPNDIAIAFEDKTISYSELNYLGNSLAYRLISDFDLKKEDVVAVIMEKSHLVPAAMFASLKTGAAYVGINLSNPPDRIKFILKDTGCKVILTDENVMRDKLSKIDDLCPVIDVPQFFDKISNNSTASKALENPKVERSSSDLGFVIYTSGSTGLPKGTLLEHRQMMRLIYKPDGLILKRGVTMAQTTAFSFDVHVFEIWGGLINGCTVCVPPESAILEAPKMKRYIQGHKINTMWLTTSLFNQFVESDISMFKGVDQLLVGGEKLSTPHINRVKEAYPKIRLFNGYGPTENSIYTTLFEIEKLYPNEIPIGRPSANSKITILDANNQPVPVGIPGELCAWGDGICRGYLNRPELNETKFSYHPLFPNERMYRIGDMGSWDSDGIMHYFGRNDDQVKVRGYRIELGEITNALIEHPDINQAIVMVRTLEDGFNKELVAYFTASKDSLKMLNAQAMRTFLSERLPGYMIPAHFVPLERMPLNPSGKVDRTNLPSPDVALSQSNKADDATDRDDKTTHTPSEKMLLRVWQKILGLSDIGIFDNYFNLGGDSIKAIQMVSLLARENQLIEVRDIFQNPTISDLARHVRPAKIMVDQSAVSGIVPLSAVQRWFFTHHHNDLHHFNQAQLILSSEEMDHIALEKALVAVQNHHDALRMRFNIVKDGDIIQENQGVDLPLDFSFLDLRGELNPESSLLKITNLVQSQIDLNGPLMKSRLIRMEDGDRLLLVLHHLIVDGLSWRILSEDIETAYRQIKAGEEVSLPAKTHSFKTWAEKVNQFATDSELMKEIEYWKSVENHKVATLPLNGESAVQGLVYQRDTATLNIYLDPEHTSNLLSTAHQTLRTQTNDLLLTALARALSTWHSFPATLINLEGHGREEIFKDIDINRTVGWFTTMYPVVIDLPKTDDISYQVKHIKETLRKVPKNGFGYGVLRYLSQKLEQSTLLPAISFNYLGRFDTDIAQGFTIAKESAGQCIGNEVEITQDIDINAIVTENGLEIALTYNTKALRENDMQNLLETFKSELETVIDHLINKAEATLTPSDIDFDGLGIDELDKVLDGIKG
ncbi:MAG: amino acid adenylation domain-containing protein [Desulfamplus sp.]|nr:amino acid adenylation domain-containing protein [Desulfamplus sp.]